MKMHGSEYPVSRCAELVNGLHVQPTKPALQSFFDESREQSRIKSRIVSKYFFAWARVIVPEVQRRGGDRLAFIDLFAGPGRYKDEMPSTPLRVLGDAVKDPTLSNMLVGLFNDAHEPHARSLEAAIDSIPDIGTLRFKPRVGNH
jgi:three-Cys-motif partner protein